MVEIFQWCGCLQVAQEISLWYSLLLSYILAPVRISNKPTGIPCWTWMKPSFWSVLLSLTVMNRNTPLLISPRKSPAAAFLWREFVSEGGCDQIATLLGVWLAFDSFVWLLFFSIGKLIKGDKSVANCLAMIAYVCQGKNVMRGIEFII